MDKFPSVEKLANIVKRARLYGVEKMTFRPKMKLHGTNGGIRVNKGSDKPVPQSRNRVLSVKDDHLNFAKFVDSLELITVPNSTFTIYGEWAGPGIQDTDAVSKIGKRTFFVFAVVIHDDEGSETLWDDPGSIDGFLSIHFDIDDRDDIQIIPWYEPEYVFDMNDTDNIQLQFDRLKARIELTIAERDTYIWDLFDVVGPGEGLVFYPQGNLKRWWREFLWKAKTAAHAEVKVKKERVVAEKPEGVDEFIDMFFTDVRMDKLLNEHFNGEADKRNTGNVLKMVMSDVHKESQDELEKADFEWKDAARYGTNRVKQWFFKKCDQI